MARAARFVVLVALLASCSSTPPTGAMPPREFHALWPERTAEDATDAQNHDGRAWRVDANETVRHLLDEALRWPDASIEPCSPGNPLCSGETGADLERFLVDRTPDARPCAGPACPPQWSVTVQRLIRTAAGGIWSVTEIRSSALSLNLEPGQDVEVPGEAAVSLTPATNDGVLAYRYGVDLEGCYGETGAQRPPIRAGVARFPLEPRQPSCDMGDFVSSEGDIGGSGPLLTALAGGYVAALRLDDGSLVSPFGDDLPDNDPIYDIAAVPVGFVPVAGEPETSFRQADPAKLDCAGGETVQGSFGYEGGGKPGAKNPTDGTREKYAKELRPDDRLEQSGPQDGEAIVRVLRQEAVVVIVHWTHHEEIGWLPDAFAHCASFAPE
ncbi:MAG: hypothetical protein LC722_07915 [Actinobacteria bacterium]|nr:hypothetical protein [Actinomycetota bacterium]